MSKRLRDDDESQSAARRFDLAQLPVDLRTRELPSWMTCESARVLALTSKTESAIATRAKTACGALATLLERSLRRIEEYADLYVAYVVRMLPDVWDHIDIVPLDGGERVLRITGDAAGELYALTGSPVALLRLHRAVHREVVDQLRVFLSWLRMCTAGEPYRVSARHLANLGAAAGNTTGLTRVLDAMIRGGSGELVARLRDGSVRPEDLRTALARAVAFSATMNARSTTGAAQLDVSALQRTEDVDLDVNAIDRASGVDPASRRWIYNAAHIVALRSPLRELTIGDVEHLLTNRQAI